MQHQLGRQYQYFSPQRWGTKTCEIVPDADYRAGDTLQLNEVDESGQVTGAWVRVLVTHVERKNPNIKRNHVLLSTKRIELCLEKGAEPILIAGEESGSTATITRIDKATFL